MKAGWKTSEFWLSILGNILGIALATGLIGPGEAEIYGDAAAQIVGAVVTVVSGAGYAVSRGIAKAGK